MSEGSAAHSTLVPSASPACLLYIVTPTPRAADMAGASGEYQDMADAVGGLEQLDPAEVGVYLASPEAQVALPSSPAAVPAARAAPSVRAAACPSRMAAA